MKEKHIKLIVTCDQNRDTETKAGIQNGTLVKIKKGRGGVEPSVFLAFVYLKL